MDRLFAVLNTAGNIVARARQSVRRMRHSSREASTGSNFSRAKRDARIWRPSSKSNAER